MNYTLLNLRQGLFSTTEAVGGQKLQGVNVRVGTRGGKLLNTRTVISVTTVESHQSVLSVYNNVAQQITHLWTNKKDLKGDQCWKVTTGTTGLIRKL